MNFANVLRIAAPILGGAAFGASIYMKRDGDKSDDTLGLLLGIGGVALTAGSALSIASMASRASTASTFVRVGAMATPFALALAGIAIGSRAAGGGAARPMSSIDDAVQGQLNARRSIPEAGVTSTIDQAKMREYVSSFDRYDGNGAHAHDGVLTQSDMSRLWHATNTPG